MADEPCSSAPEALDAANATFRVLAKAQHIFTIMSELHSTDAYVTRQPSSQILFMLRSPERTKTIQEMCALFRACTFSAVKLKAIAPAQNHQQASSTRPAAPSGVSAAGVPMSQGQMAVTNEQADVAMSSTSEAPAAEASSPSKPSTSSPSMLANAKALKTVLVTIPDSTKSFLQGKLVLGHSAARILICQP